MLKWCAFCQQFKGEVAPFDQLVITHGLCPTCDARGIDLAESELAHAHKLRDLQFQLMGAASVEDFREVERIVDRAVAAQVRPIDILLGLVAPSLYLIGEQWRKGAITVTQEHRFSAFCEKVYQLVVEKVMSQPDMNLASTRPEALLVNAKQNHHTLAIRILALWFKSKGIEPLALYPFPGLEVLIDLVEQMRPRLLLISIALAEQRSSVVGIVERLKSSAIENKPKVVIGGYAVKSGMIAPIAGASLVVDISELEELVGSWAREQP